MRKITNPNIDKLVKNHYEKYKFLNIFDSIKMTNCYRFKSEYKKVTDIFEKEFENIITGKPEDIRGYIEKISKSNINFNRIKKQPKKELSPEDTDHNFYIECLDKIFDYESIDKIEFSINLNLTICPYCNREYIFKFEDNGQNNSIRVLSDLDHFYSQSHYPYLAISFYNLIPSCSICNRKFKTTINFYENKHLHPFEEDFHLLTKFNLEIIDSTFYYKTYGFNINLLPKDNVTGEELEKTKNTISTFRLDEIYRQHKDIVLDLIQKKYLYSDEYIESLFKQYEGTLFKSKEQLLGLLFGNYLSEEDISKRPLSKLTCDMATELGVI